MTVAVRPATPADPADALLYAVGQAVLRRLRRLRGARPRAAGRPCTGRTGHAASFEVCSVAELDGDAGRRDRLVPGRRGRRAGAPLRRRSPRRACRRGAGRALLRHLRAAGHGLAQPAAEHAVRRRARRRPGLPPPRRRHARCSSAPSAAAAERRPRRRGARHRPAQRARPRAVRARRLPRSARSAARRARRRRRDRRPRLRQLLQARCEQRLGHLRDLALGHLAGRTAARPSARRRPRRPGTRPRGGRTRSR